MSRPRANSSPLFTLVTVVIVVGALVFAKEILLPLALAILFSFVLTPIAERIERLGLGRIPSVVLVVALSFALLVGMGWTVTTQLIDFGRELPTYKSNIVEKIKAITPTSTTLDRLTTAFTEMRRELSGRRASREPEGPTKPTDKQGSSSTSGKIDSGVKPDRDLSPKSGESKSRRLSTSPPPNQTAAPAEDTAEHAIPVEVVATSASPLSMVQAWLGPLVTPLTTVGIVVVLVLFMLIQREDQRNRLIRLFGSANLHATTEALNDVSERISRYLRMQFLINTGYGVLVGLGLSLIGVPSALLWGVLGFALRFLPYIGPWLGAAMPVAVSLAVSPGWTQPLLVVGWYVILEVVAGNVVEPWLFGHSVGVSGLGIILAAIFWTWLWGPIGLVLAVPLTVCLVVTAQYIPQLHFIAVLIGDQPTLSLEERIYQRLLAFDEDEPRKLAKQYLASAPLAKLYDEVLIPVLAFAERARHDEVLSESQTEFIEDAAEELVEELGQSVGNAPAADESGAESSTAGEAPPVKILCVPLRDQADRTSTLMLSQLLSAEGFQVEIGSLDSLTTEIVDQVATLHSDIVILSILPPVAPRQTRLLRRRLRTRYPTLPIILGLWQAGDAGNMFRKFELDGDTQIANTLGEAISAVRTASHQVRLDLAHHSG